MTRGSNWYKEFWPWFIVVLLSSVIVACIFTIYLALKYDDPPVVGEYRKQGLGVVAVESNDNAETRSSEGTSVTRAERQ